MGIVHRLAFRMGVAAAGVASQISVKAWMNMIQLVKDGNHLLVKRLVHKSGQTECDVVQHFHAVEQMPLNLKGATASAHMHGAVWEP